MKEIRKEIAKIISSSGDLQGATWEELKKIDKLVKLFKSYARSLIPKGLSIYKTSDGWAIEYEKINFIEGSKKKGR